MLEYIKNNFWHNLGIPIVLPIQPFVTDWTVRDSKLRGGSEFSILHTRPSSVYSGGYQGSFSGIKWLGHGFDNPPPYSAVVENEYSYICTIVICSSYGLLCGELYLTHYRVGSRSDKQFCSCIIINYVWCCDLLKRFASGCRRCPRRNKCRVPVPTVRSGRSDGTVYRPYRV